VVNIEDINDWARNNSQSIFVSFVIWDFSPDILRTKTNPKAPEITKK
jgi:hypothetical protein